MKILIVAALFFVSAKGGSQNIEWSDTVRLQLSDFKSPSTKIGNVNAISLRNGSQIDFSFRMTNGEFMLTKNFNSKVGCSFQPIAASIIAPDSATANNMLDFARYEFDLAELYARKFRKKLFENKGAFSNIGFFQPIYIENQKEYAERDTQAGQESEIGGNKERMKQLHDEVLKEIQQLADFCKTCKPSKRKK